jgi:hypothetical protein
LTGDPPVSKNDRNAEIPVSVIRRFGEIELENLEISTGFIDRNVPVHTGNVSADIARLIALHAGESTILGRVSKNLNFALQKVNIAEGDTELEACHKDIWDRREELSENEERTEDPI